MSNWREALESAYVEASPTETQDAGQEATPAPSTETASVESKAPEADSEAPESTEAAPAKEAKKESSGFTTRGANGKFVKGQTTSTKAPEQPLTGAKAATPVPKSGETTPTKAPQSWKPAEREAWGKMPPEAHAAVARREAEFARAMQETAPHRQVGQAFQQMISPYEGLIRSQGGEPLRTVESAMQTLYALHTAPPGHKAGIVANIISTFGVDPAHVAAVLQGQGVPQQAQQQQFDPNAIAQHVEQRITQGMQQRQMAALTNHYEQKWEEFASANDFAHDLRPAMAKLIESGLANDFEDAYAKASGMDPSVSAAMRQREEAKQANAVRASTQRSRAAASSLKSSPAGPTRTPQPNGLRGNLSEIYDRLSGQSR